MIFKFILLSLCILFDVVVSLPEPETGLDVSHVQTLSRWKRGGACTSTADCVAGNVCSKWGWCQWTSIYGSDGPSQGSSAPGGGVAGQCKTSADCASRVPYCSKLGFCHGGRLPFDEAQLEIDEADKEEKDDQPQGFINNNPRKNNPILRKSGNSKTGGSKSGRNNTNKSSTKSNANKRTSSSGNKRPTSNSNKRPSGNGNRRNGGNKSTSHARKSSSSGGRSNSNKRKQNGSGGSSGGSGSGCPGGNLDSCIDACIPIKKVAAYGACVTVCANRCK